MLTVLFDCYLDNDGGPIIISCLHSYRLLSHRTDGAPVIAMSSLIGRYLPEVLAARQYVFRITCEKHTLGLCRGFSFRVLVRVKVIPDLTITQP